MMKRKFSRGGSSKGTVKKLKTLSRKVSRLSAAVEHKTNGLNISDNVPTPTPAFVTLTNMVLGTTNGTRIGTKFSVHTLQLGWVAAPQGTATDCSYRVMLFHDREMAGAVTPWASLSPNSTAGKMHACGLYPRGTGPNPKRIRILYDKVFTTRMGAAYTGGVGQSVQHSTTHRVEMKFKSPLKCYFNTGNAGTTADCTAGLLLCIVSEQAAGASVDIYGASVTFSYSDD